MNFDVGDKVLITSDNWFIAPDGHQYRAVWGTVKGIHDSESVLGVRTNSKSTNWYIEIGNMLLAGCQAHMAISYDKVYLGRVTATEFYKGVAVTSPINSRIYNADQ